MGPLRPDSQYAASALNAAWLQIAERAWKRRLDEPPLFREISTVTDAILQSRAPAGTPSKPMPCCGARPRGADRRGDRVPRAAATVAWPSSTPTRASRSVSAARGVRRTRVTDEQVLHGLTWARKLRRRSELARVRQARPEVAGEAHAARRHDRAFGAPGCRDPGGNVVVPRPAGSGRRTERTGAHEPRGSAAAAAIRESPLALSGRCRPPTTGRRGALGAKYEPETKGARRPRHLPSTRARSRRSMEEAKPRCARPGRLLSRAKSAPGRYQALGSWSRRDSSVGRAYD
jgi:hypothetical protein